jgi:integral membrane protein
MYNLPTDKYNLMIANLLKSALGRFRIIAFLEGTSFLILLFIAMPLKYIGGMPWAVRQVGMAHGVLFILYLFALAHAMFDLKWSVGKGLIAFVASLVPFGTFVLDSKMLSEEMPSTPTN